MSDVAERVKRDDEVCKELERLEKRVKEEIIAATERAQSFALMEIEPLRLEIVEKIEGFCEALFGLENGKVAGKDAQTIKAMTRTIFLESPRSLEMYLGGGGSGAGSGATGDAPSFVGVIEAARCASKPPRRESRQRPLPLGRVVMPVLVSASIVPVPVPVSARSSAANEVPSIARY